MIADGRGDNACGSTSTPSSPDVKPPRAPGVWVDALTCRCGAQYADHRSDANFARAVTELRAMAKSQGDETGGFRRRNAVLWMMRVQKLNHWYWTHSQCCAATSMDGPFGESPAPVDEAADVYEPDAEYGF